MLDLAERARESAETFAEYRRLQLRLIDARHDLAEAERALELAQARHFAACEALDKYESEG